MKSGSKTQKNNSSRKSGIQKKMAPLEPKTAEFKGR